MPARSKARKRALDVLFEAELRSAEPLVVLDELVVRSQHELNPFTGEVVAGVMANRARIDELISTYSLGWTLSRMPGVDRNLLRIGIWELLWGDAPDGVVLAEVTRMASELSTDESGPFVNGLLARVVEVREHLVLDK
ncbi:MAG: transcription antitermination factor NusB [Candidatus Nanopelagicales bacterium]|nr:transcription antitermination factor NusB [Candidatus Nanopelagicales bacterium]